MTRVSTRWLERRGCCASADGAARLLAPSSAVDPIADRVRAWLAEHP